MTETRIAQYRCGNSEHVTFCIDTVHTKRLDHDTDVLHQGPINPCVDGLALRLGKRGKTLH